MNQTLALKVLSRIMNWCDDRARKEFRWLRLMARLKYDGYGDFQAGMRFIESFAAWLQQFSHGDRNAAYLFVRKTLVYIGPAEMQRFVEQFYPRNVHEQLVRMIATERSIPTYCVLADASARKELEQLRRQTLFMGLSDGARIDKIRRANAGRLSNEQFVGIHQVSGEKWKDLLSNLRTDLNDESAKFRLIFLIDDFTASGTTFLRQKIGAGWEGKLIRFRDSIAAAETDSGVGGFLAPRWKLYIHHYLASAEAKKNIDQRLQEAEDFLNTEGWADDVHPTYGMVLPADLPVNAGHGRCDDFVELAHRYYDPAIETGDSNDDDNPNMALGYRQCALPVVLDHNTPNNSVALIWAESAGSELHGNVAHAMQPLFRRHQRHV